MGKIWSIFAESDGTGSWSRIQGFLSLMAAIFWNSHVVWHTHAIPDLHNTAYFLTATNLPYAVNKLHDGVTSVMVPQAPDEAQNVTK